MKNRTLNWRYQAKALIENELNPARDNRYRENAAGFWYPDVKIPIRIPGPWPTSGDISVQRGKDRRVCFLNHHYRSVIKLASLGFKMAGSRRFERPP
jgi:hypothetical protein